MKGWWLDSVCGENWDACIVEANGVIIAAMPYYFQKRFVFTLLNMPKLTSGLGPWIKYPGDQKYSSRISYEHQLIEQLIHQLPSFDYFNQRFRHSASNCQAFHWKGFSLSLRYNYILPDLTNLDNVLAEFNANIRREIKKAEKTVRVIESNDIDKFYEINQLTFQRNKITIPYTKELLTKINNACSERNNRKILLAIDESNQVHGALYLVWDNQSAYYLMGGMDHRFKSGAFSLLMWHAIQEAARMNLTFDFEGSMIESVERFFREFGAKQVVYAQVQKTNSQILRLASFLKLT